MADQDRIYEILRKQGEMLAMLERIDERQQNTHERLFGANGLPGVIPYLHTEVARHTRQIAFWKGGLAILTFLWGAALAWGGIIISKRH
jgi:hypothetical protein